MKMNASLDTRIYVHDRINRKATDLPKTFRKGLELLTPEIEREREREMSREKKSQRHRENLRVFLFDSRPIGQGDIKPGVMD